VPFQLFGPRIPLPTVATAVPISNAIVRPNKVERH
jgi:hypothetical protein